MRSPTPMTPFRLLGPALVAVVLLDGCDSGSAPTPVPVTSSSAGPTSSGGTDAPPTTGSATTAPPATGTALPSGPSTPATTPGTFTVAVTGAGQVAYPVTAVRCAGAAVTGTATPADGGTPGTVTLDTGSGVLTVAGLPPLDGTRLTGSVSGAPTAGTTVRWTGDGTGAAASLQLTCP